MRRLLLGALAIATLSCDNGPTGPTSTVDGTWTGTAPGFDVTFTLAQQDTIVTGNATILGVSGGQAFSDNGTIVARQLAVTLAASGYIPVSYAGTLSSVEAKIDGQLDGSGFNKLALTV